MDELSGSFTKRHPGVRILKNFGASGALAMQIEGGAPADVFISASGEWVERLLGIDVENSDRILPEYQHLHVIATVGSWILVSGIIVMVVNFFVSLRRGEVAGPNPWGGKTLEWTISSPPPPENFDEIPVVTTGPYDYSTTPAEHS